MKAQVLGEVLPLAEQDADAVSAMINLAMISQRSLRVLLGGSLDGQALDKDPIGSSGQLR
jgi:hypothetical protein